MCSGENEGPELRAQPRQPQAEQRYGRRPVTSFLHASHVDRVRDAWTLGDLQCGHRSMTTAPFRMRRAS